MRAAVVLNRVFRTEHNPLLEYVYERLDDYDKLYLVIPVEQFDEDSELKKSYYLGTLKHFVETLETCHIEPYVISYDNLETFLKEEKINTVITAGDIMSYHQKSYDIHTMKQLYQKLDITSVILRVNHYFNPAVTLNHDKAPYKVFTSFYKKNRGRIKKKQLNSYNLKSLSEVCETGTVNIELDSDNGLSEQSAVKNWGRYLKDNIHDYEKNREILAEVKTSQLSIALSHGVLDIRMIMNDLLEAYEMDEKGVEAFIRELMFREFYYVLMVYYPDTAEQSFKEKYRNIKWSDSQTNFNAWKEGRTGYPLIDAAMNELKETGYMHNRMRMVTAQFLTKHLFTDWRKGETYFRHQLIDYDNASNVHGWQWAASTGTDAVPYFRMFNPVRQSERFDSDGAYIKKYLKIFKDVPAKYLHHPEKNNKVLEEKYNIKIGEDYPKRIVDHSEARDFIMDIFKQY